MKEKVEKLRQVMLIARIAMSNQGLRGEMPFMLGITNAELEELDEFASNCIEESFLTASAPETDSRGPVLWN